MPTPPDISDLLDYTPPAKATIPTPGQAHFEVRNAANPWGYEVEDLRNGTVYTQGIFDQVLGFGGGSALTTAVYLCNPTASLYNNIQHDGPVSPVIRLNGHIQGNVTACGFGGGVQGSIDQDVCLWTNDGNIHHNFLTPGTGIAIGSNGPLYIIGANGGNVDVMRAAGFGQSHNGQEYGLFEVFFANLTIEAQNAGATYCMLGGAGGKLGHIQVYNCWFSKNPDAPGAHGGTGIKSAVRLEHGATYDFRDNVLLHRPLEHFFYLNSVNAGTRDLATIFINNRTTQGEGTIRTFYQGVSRAEESNVGGGRNILYFEGNQALDCSQDGSADYSFIGFLGDIIMRDNSDISTQPTMGRAILTWEAGNKTEPKVDEGTYYNTIGTNHGRLVVTGQNSQKPNLASSSVYAIGGVLEFHLIAPFTINSNRRAIMLDSTAHLVCGPQYDQFGVLSYLPETGVGNTLCNNTSTTGFAGGKSGTKQPINGDGTPGPITGQGGSNFEFIYVPSPAENYVGFQVPNKDILFRSDVNSTVSLTDSGEYFKLDPEDYRADLGEANVPQEAPFNPTYFFPPADWRVTEPQIEFIIPASIQESKLGLEQRNTPYQEGEVTRQHKISYVSWGQEESGTIQNLLKVCVMRGGQVLLPFIFEPMVVTADFSSTNFFSAAPQVGGPDWYLTSQILRPPTPLSLEIYTPDKQFFVCRTDYRFSNLSEVRRITAYTKASGYTLFTLQNPWNLPIPPERAVYYFCDVVTALSVNKTSKSDDKHQWDITWESILSTFK